MVLWSKAWFFHDQWDPGPHWKGCLDAKRFERPLLYTTETMSSLTSRCGRWCVALGTQYRLLLSCGAYYNGCASPNRKLLSACGNPFPNRQLERVQVKKWGRSRGSHGICEESRCWRRMEGFGFCFPGNKVKLFMFCSCWLLIRATGTLCRLALGGYPKGNIYILYPPRNNHGYIQLFDRSSIEGKTCGKKLTCWWVETRFNQQIKG